MLNLKSVISFLTDIGEKPTWRSKDLSQVIRYLSHLELRLSSLERYKKNSKKNIRDLQRALDKERRNNLETSKTLRYHEKKNTELYNKIHKLKESRCKLCDETAAEIKRRRMLGAKQEIAKSEAAQKLKNFANKMHDLEPDFARVLEENFWDILA